MTRARARAGFVAAVTEQEPALDVACACMAAEETTGVDPAEIVGRLDALAASIQTRPRTDALAGEPARFQAERLARLTIGLFGEGGFAGDVEHYDNPENSLLDRVLARRRGLPILLGVVLLEVARRQDVPLVGVGFPGHFLVASPTEPPVVLDPFHGGRVVPRAALEDRLRHLDGQPPTKRRVAQALAPVGARYILARINNNLKGAWLRRGDVPGALRAVERLLLVAPDLPEEIRDRGLMRLQLGDEAAGLRDLERYLELAPDAGDRDRIVKRIQKD